MTLTRAEYEALPGIRWSHLKAMRDSPAAYRYAVENPREDTAAFAFGRAVHSAILTPFLFDADFVACDIRRDARTQAYKDFLSENEGKTILSRDQWDECLAISSAVRQHPVVAPYLDGDGHAEVPIRWTNPETGLECKGIVDWLTVVRGTTILLDLKTAAVIDAPRFGVAAARYGYHCQLAFYRDGLRARGWNPGKVAILAIEKSPPYDCGIFALTADHALYAGREEYLTLLRRVAECLDSDRWPGRYETERALELPAWLFSDPTDADDLGITIEED